jgi:hypothetical protein
MTIPIVGTGLCDAVLRVNGDAVPSNQQKKLLDVVLVMWTIIETPE